MINPYTHQEYSLLIVISGPSGVGKDAVIEQMKLLGYPFHFVITATSRPKRSYEVHGQDYFFVSKHEFETMIEKGKLLEYAVVYDEYKGIPKAQVQTALASGKDVVMRIDVQGARTIRQIIPESILVYLSAESEDALMKRLQKRKTESQEQLAIRIKTARQEHEQLDLFDYIVINRAGELDTTCATIASIIKAERCRVHQKEIQL
ncbi:MAG: guanylate kinase [Anaerolineaceae bacterium 4572_78]|nr:MAG: guanylate kinase [Anaerolineaceae bacterium 4572_78]